MLSIILKLLKNILTGMSPEIRKLILEFLRDLEAKAEETPNPIDDIVVLLLRILFGF
ncbi:hypothetical protein ES708_28410 [subsurface metagenome]